MQRFNLYKNQIIAGSGGLILLGYLLGIAGYSNSKAVALVLATILASLPIASKAFQALRMRVFSIELLVTIAVIGALYIQEYSESAIVTFLFLFGAYLEARTLEKTRSSLKKLLDMAPQEATVIRDREQVTIAAEDVVKGDRVVIRSGSKIPVDGVVLMGTAEVDEAAVTGEPIPVSKKQGDRLFSGTMIEYGYLEMLAEKVGDDTTFARIIELVEEAQEAKSKATRFLDRFARIYTPGIVILSILAFLVTKNLHMAITFLVVACPGALVIGAPVSNVAGIGNGARHGVLLKGGEVIDAFSKVDTLIFDKTGTLTRGKPEVTQIQTFHGYDPDELLASIASLEAGSEHHLGRAIVKYAEEKNLSVQANPEEFHVKKGQGVHGSIEGQEIVVGNRALLKNLNISLADDVINQAAEKEYLGETVVFAAVQGKIAGIISISDQIRVGAREALQELRDQGIKRMVMLTGDNAHSARLVADRLCLDEFHAELMPEDKVAFVQQEKAKGHRVAMAGDGINDAPAIAAADIGLAMGEGGTDISMETADIVLMADKLSQLSHAYALSKATMKNMKQNIVIAVIVVAFLLTGVLTGTVHLTSGMFIHEISILVVIVNAMRLIQYGLGGGTRRKGKRAMGIKKYNHQNSL